MGAANASRWGASPHPVGQDLNNSGYNILICTSSFGPGSTIACGIIARGLNDQFLAGTSVSGDGAYWVSYYTHTTSRTLPLFSSEPSFPSICSGSPGTAECSELSTELP